MTIYISVDRKRIKENHDLGVRRPVLVVEDDNGRHEYVKEVHINGPCKVVYRPDKPDRDDPLSTAWVEVEDDVGISIPF